MTKKSVKSISSVVNVQSPVILYRVIQAFLQITIKHNSHLHININLFKCTKHKYQFRLNPFRETHIQLIRQKKVPFTALRLA